MKNTCLLVHCISSLEGTSNQRIHNTASLPVPLFLVLHRIRTYISRYFYIFLEPIRHLLEKDFCHEFSFINGFTPSPHLLNG